MANIRTAASHLNGLVLRFKKNDRIEHSWTRFGFLVKLQEMVELECKSWASQGLNINYELRDGRKGYKAGALKSGMGRSYVRRCEFVAVFDADFRPEPDFLLRTVPFLVYNPKIALVQARWDFGMLLDNNNHIRNNCNRNDLFNFYAAMIWRHRSLFSFRNLRTITFIWLELLESLTINGRNLPISCMRVYERGHVSTMFSERFGDLISKKSPLMIIDYIYEFNISMVT